MSQSLLTGLTLPELASLLGSPERPSVARARVLLRWLWKDSAGLRPLPDHLEGINARALEALRTAAAPPGLEETSRRLAADGTLKLLLRSEGTPLECVMIPGRGRTTVCVSSQSGCTRDCTFCATALMGFHRNLLAGEIVAQVLRARQVAPVDRPVRNVVFMGMGEPLDNLEEVVRAVEVLCTPGGAGLSPHHITVSTSGVLPKMREFVSLCDANLALSLNGTTEAQRRELMPIDRKWPLPALIEFIAEQEARRLTFIEYILMGGFNDRLEDAQRLVELLRGLSVRVNLIPFNPHPGTRFRRPASEDIDAFFSHLNGNGIRTLVRLPRGDDIAAACGQLQRMESQRSRLSLVREGLRCSPSPVEP